MQTAQTSRAWIEVDVSALRTNFEAVRRVVGSGPAIIAMVKADGYGLGAERIARALEPLAPWGYGVAAAEEGEKLRAAGITRPILVVSPLARMALERAAAVRLTPAISSLDALERWAAAASAAPEPLDFHVEVDTGMGRAGFDWRETGQWAAAVKARVGPALRWTGIFTHFHGADAAEKTPTATQWERFLDALAQLPVSREDLLVHAANSAAALRWPEFAADAVRPGIYLYGANPAPGVAGEALRPRPVASVRARIVLVRDVPPGSTVGYGATHAARGWERWGTLAIGYGDGLPRALGNRGAALVRGRRVPMVGRISMDMTVIDLTSVPDAGVGDVATLIGGDGDERITVEEVAAQADTIAYEILTGLTARLPRVEC
ncbi:MAG: alanine racemase [Gemmatimonadetes bacterium]|nr:alanine racemase [Gemmatimonadota bacterium]